MYRASVPKYKETRQLSLAFGSTSSLLGVSVAEELGRGTRLLEESEWKRMKAGVGLPSFPTPSLRRSTFRV